MTLLQRVHAGERNYFYRNAHVSREWYAGLQSILLDTESVAQNCWKGISLGWRTLSGTFLCRHLECQPNIRQKYETLHDAALPSSACVAYRMTFNDHFDIFWGQRKLFQVDGIHWSQLTAKVLRENLLHRLHILPLVWVRGARLQFYGNLCRWSVTENNYSRPEVSVGLLSYIVIVCTKGLIQMMRNDSLFGFLSKHWLWINNIGI